MPRDHDCVMELDEWCNVCTEARLQAGQSVTRKLLAGYKLVRSTEQPWHMYKGSRYVDLSVDEVMWIEDL